MFIFFITQKLLSTGSPKHEFIIIHVTVLIGLDINLKCGYQYINGICGLKLMVHYNQGEVLSMIRFVVS